MRGVSGSSPCSSRCRICSPTRVPPGSCVTVTVRPASRRAVGEQFDLRRLARTLAALEGDEHAAAAHPAPAGGVAAQRHLEVGPHADLLPVVHLAVGEHPGREGEQAAGDQHEAGAVDGGGAPPAIEIRRRPTCATTNGTAASARISTTRMSDWSSANTRPRITSSISVPINVMPGQVRDAGAEADADHEDHREGDLRHDRGQDQAGAAEDDCQPEQPAAGQLACDARPEGHARAEADEHRPEQHAVGRVAAAQAGDEDLAGADDRAAGGERTDQADDQAADQARMPDEGRALAQQAEQAGLLVGGALAR